MTRLTAAMFRLALAMVALLAGAATAGEPNGPAQPVHWPTQVYWGDTHLHTRLSMDAGAMGTVRTPEDAYRFARGERIVSTSGVPAQLSRPLDFLVIADHSDALGTVTEIMNGNPFFATDPKVRRWQDMIASGEDSQLLAAVFEIVGAFGASEDLPGILLDESFARRVWDDYTAVADRFYAPGQFTALIGYEWTSMPDWNNLHRVVIYRDGGETVRQLMPARVADGMDPEDLWRWMQRYEAETSGRVLAIPHNGNISEGLMFATKRFDGSPMSAGYARTRSRWEPIYETTQVKGDSETHPLLSPNDEFADYETWDDGNFHYDGADPATLAGDYARSGLKRGLEIAGRLGINPFQFGLIGSTDSHTGLATSDENNFFGKFVYGEPAPERWRPWTPSARRAGWEYVASGLAAVWAAENTREAIFDAMLRREVYATTGPRITLRFFGGWDFREEDADGGNLSALGYAKGVPMGAELSAGPEGRAPGFLLAAVKDPESGNLDRIQIVKGWLDATGRARERVYDVAWSGARTLDSAGRLPPVGNTVDIVSATWKNTIGSAQLAAVWTDPDFNPHRPAFYYARVIEIPTPRWTAYDAKTYEQALPADVSMTTRERAYGSPIWYSP
ncbi:MAG: DUF3604 domain-containing protein [Gammaproteobacteria bacterium]|nr:DUF3604 domain-containing protein [Gammaproteobacteria bacterium]